MWCGINSAVFYVYNKFLHKVIAFTVVLLGSIMMKGDVKGLAVFVNTLFPQSGMTHASSQEDLLNC